MKKKKRQKSASVRGRHKCGGNEESKEGEERGRKRDEFRCRPGQVDL